MGKKKETPDIQAMYEHALAHHQQGDLKQAVKLYSQVIFSVPDIAGIHYNLALALFESGQFSDAADAYTRAAELSPEDADIFYNLGLAWKKAGRHNEAEQAYIKALTLVPGDQDVLYNLGCCYLNSGATENARKTFEMLIEQTPEHISALNNLAYANHLLENYTQAKDLYKQVVELDPDRESARYMYNVLNGSTEKAPPKEYIRELFDRYSESYDQSLVENLECSLYNTMREICDKTTPEKSIYKHGLDLGCGTGLSGEAFRSACRGLSGVDLSQKMIDRAAEKKIYDNLECNDIIDFLDTAEENFDLLIAADVLPYLGDLTPLFKAAASKGGEDTIFCFSCETSLQGQWVLQPSGRYAHHPDYILKTAEETNWKVLHKTRTNIRKEKKEWVKGYIFILTRQQ